MGHDCLRDVSCVFVCWQVKDRVLWRAALENGGYSPQTDEAPFAQIQSPKKDRYGSPPLKLLPQLLGLGRGELGLIFFFIHK